MGVVQAQTHCLCLLTSRHETPDASTPVLLSAGGLLDPSISYRFRFLRLHPVNPCMLGVLDGLPRPNFLHYCA